MAATEKKGETDERKRALEAALREIEKNFGKGAVMCLGEKAAARVEALPTGILPLDFALGIGGLPRGRVIEVFGPESGGKTTIALHAVAEAQRRGELCAFVDAEHALDPIYAEKIGVDLKKLYLSQPSSGEEALEISDTLIRSGAIGVLVVDSVAALVPKAELEGDMGAPHVGLQARLMSQALRKLTATVARTRSIVLFINQLREKVGVMFGSPETTPGGRALKFYSSVRLEVRGGQIIRKGDAVVGREVKVKVAKNKVAPPFRQALLAIRYGEGIDRLGGLLDLGVERGVVAKKGAWLEFGGEALGQGRDAARESLASDPKKAAALERAVLAKLHPERVAAGCDGDEEKAGAGRVSPLESNLDASRKAA